MEIGLDRDDYEYFVKDAMKNCIVVGGMCKNACVFCSCKAQKAACRKNWTNYISEKDLLSIIDFINPLQTIYFGEGPSFLSCEPFQHPQYLNLLRILRGFFPQSKIMTTTIGKNILPHNYSIIKELNLEFVISINTFNKEKRLEIAKSEDDLIGLKEFLKECSELITKTSFMHYGDINMLKKDIEILYDIDSSYIEKESLLRMTDYSIYHNKETIKLYEEGKKTWYEAVKVFDKVFISPSYWLTSLTDFPLDVKVIDNVFLNYNIHKARESFKNQINKIIKQVEGYPHLEIEDTAFLLSESVYDYFKKEFKHLNGILVKNLTFKGSYRVSGLLTKHDIMNAILKEKKYNSYVLPKTMFNKFLRDLHNNHAHYDFPIQKIILS